MSEEDLPIFHYSEHTDDLFEKFQFTGYTKDFLKGWLFRLLSVNDIDYNKYIDAILNIEASRCYGCKPLCDGCYDKANVKYNDGLCEEYTVSKIA